MTSPTKQSVFVGGGRVVRLFYQRGGALEGLVGPCEAGAHTGGGQDQGNGRETAVQLRQHGRHGMTAARTGGVAWRHDGACLSPRAFVVFLLVAGVASKGGIMVPGAEFPGIPT